MYGIERIEDLLCNNIYLVHNYIIMYYHVCNPEISKGGGGKPFSRGSKCPLPPLKETLRGVGEPG